MPKSPKQHRRFVKLWLGTLLTFLFCVALFNYMVDPYGLFDTRRIKGINAVKPSAADHVRTVKPYQVDSYLPRTVIAGNSRPEMGLDPLNRCWPTESRPVFNLGLPGSSIYMQARTLQHAVSNNNVDLVLWGLDFLDFLGMQKNEINPWKSPKHRAEFEDRLTINADGSGNSAFKWKKLEDQFNALLSLDTVKDSLGTVFRQNSHYASSIRRDGFNPARDYLEIIAWEGQSVLFKQKNSELLKMFSRPGLRLYHDDTNWSQQFESVTRFLDFATDHDVKVVLFINPYHTDYLSTLQSTGHWSNFNIWKRQLASLADKHEVTLWDFSYINSFTAEKVPKPGDKMTILKWFWEPAHYRREYGNLMLSQMLGRSCDSGESSSVGTLITAKNLDWHLIQTQKDMKRYTGSRN